MLLPYTGKQPLFHVKVARQRLLSLHEIRCAGPNPDDTPNSFPMFCPFAILEMAIRRSLPAKSTFIAET
jgi:hypothetical protein